MQEITIGEMLEHLRKKRGVSKERLSDGICSKMTLSRYERDERIPDKFVIDSLLERLEQNPEKLEFIASDEEFQITLYRDEIEEHLECGRFAEAEAVLGRYEKEIKKEEKLHKQYIRLKYGELFFAQKEYQKALEALRSALSYTGREEILTKGLEERLLSFTELELLYKIAETYYKLEACSCSASLFLMLEKYLEKLDEKNEKRLRFFSGVLYYLGVLEKQFQHWERADDYLSKAEKLMRKEFRLQGLSDIMKARIQVEKQLQKAPEQFADKEKLLLALEMISMCDAEGMLTEEGIRLWENTVNQQL